MSLYAADSTGYLQDVASHGGWSDFIAWASTVGGPVAAFAETGFTDDPAALADALGATKAPVASVETTRQGLEEAANTAEDVLIVTDGVGGEDALRVAFDPNEPRDEKGQWTTGASDTPEHWRKFGKVVSHYVDKYGPDWLAHMSKLTQDEFQQLYRAAEAELRDAGGEGSGNFGHAGRPGEVGGSAPSGAEVEKLAKAMVEHAATFPNAYAHRGPITSDTKLTELNDYQRFAIKQNIVKNISEKLAADIGIPPGYPFSNSSDRDKLALDYARNAVQENVDLWSDTSGDSFPPAIAMQQLVKETFHLDDAAIEHMKGEGFGRGQDWRKELNTYSRPYLEEEYRQTQDFLQKNGIDYVSVYRGTREHYDRGQMDVGLQPASSWTTDRATAMRFAGPGTVLTARVPRSRVLSTSVTGRGSAAEAEVILLGGKLRVNAIPRNNRQNTLDWRKEIDATVK